MLVNTLKLGNIIRSQNCKEIDWYFLLFCKCLNVLINFRECEAVLFRNQKKIHIIKKIIEASKYRTQHEQR